MVWWTLISVTLFTNVTFEPVLSVWVIFSAILTLKISPKPWSKTSSDYPRIAYQARELDYNKKSLNQIFISESSKVYLVKEVTEINKSEVFKPYKELYAKIAAVISANDKKYPYPKSLSSTIIEASHHQQFFSQHLPRLTDVTPKNKNEFACLFIENLVFGVLGK